MNLRSFIGVLILGLSWGCSSNSSTTSIDWAKGRGTAACQQWQRSYCELAARCGGIDMTTCATQMQSFECASDATASSCATALGANNCSSQPTGCDINDVADPTFAIAACNTYQNAICTHNATCGTVASVDTCLTDSQATLDCTTALGVKLAYEQCLSTVNSATCTTPMPTECKTIFYGSS